jgi:hypothetical protein
VKPFAERITYSYNFEVNDKAIYTSKIPPKKAFITWKKVTDFDELSSEFILVTGNFAAHIELANE